MSDKSIMLASCIFLLGFGVSHFMNRRKKSTATDCAVLSYLLNQGNKNGKVQFAVLKHLETMAIDDTMYQVARSCLVNATYLHDTESISDTESIPDTDDEESTASVSDAESTYVRPAPTNAEKIARYEDFIQDLVELSAGKMKTSDLLNAIQAENVGADMMEELFRSFET